MTYKASVQKQNRERSTSDADDLAAHLPNDLKRAMSLARENGASVWLTALLLQEHGFGRWQGAPRQLSAGPTLTAGQCAPRQLRAGQGGLRQLQGLAGRGVCITAIA